MSEVWVGRRSQGTVTKNQSTISLTRFSFYFSSLFVSHFLETTISIPSLFNIPSSHQHPYLNTGRRFTKNRKYIIFFGKKQPSVYLTMDPVPHPALISLAAPRFNDLQEAQQDGKINQENPETYLKPTKNNMK